MKRLLFPALPALLVMGMLALPAHAGGSAHIAIIGPGVLGVGTNYDPGLVCTKQGLNADDVKGKGLRAPGFKNPGDNGRRVWAFDAPVFDVPWGPGTMKACGKLKGVLGGNKAPVNGMQFGAWCGMSKGYDGQGKIQPVSKKMHPNGTGLSRIQLTNLHWKFGAALVALKGNWEEVPANKTKGKASSPRGKVWALINHQGSFSCIEPGGNATAFGNVGGVLWLAPDALTSAKPNLWNEKGPELPNGCRVFEKHNDCFYKAKS